MTELIYVLAILVAGLALYYACQVAFGVAKMIGEYDDSLESDRADWPVPLSDQRAEDWTGER